MRESGEGSNKIKSIYESYLRNFGGKRFEDFRTSPVAGVQVAIFRGVSCGSLNGSIVYTLVLVRDRINFTSNMYHQYVYIHGRVIFSSITIIIMLNLNVITLGIKL